MSVGAALGMAAAPRGEATPALLAMLEREVGLAFAPGDARLADALARHGRARPSGSADAGWDGFVGGLLVHETSFFRHPRQLDAIERRIMPELAARARAEGRDQVSIWSASCSTGEEAWTLALMAEAAMPGRASIVGSDLSADAVEAARCARYRASASLGSFRSLTPELAARFGGLPPAGEAWSPDEALRRRVRFLRHNLLEPPPLAGLDLVFCRNTLIYMSRAARARVVDNVARVLRPGGYLALGPAERPDGDPRFEPAKPDEAFLFRRVEAPEGAS